MYLMQHVKVKRPEVFMKTAYLWSTQSKCQRLHVGAVIVDSDMRVVSTGYNGTPSGYNNCCDYFKYKSGCWFVHRDIGVEQEDVISEENGWCQVEEEDFRKYHHEFSEEHECHAEQNAVYNLFKQGVTQTNNLSIYCTTIPCLQCAKMIVNIGIKKVVYDEEYDRLEGNPTIDYLEMYNVECRQIKEYVNAVDS